MVGRVVQFSVENTLWFLSSSSSPLHSIKSRGVHNLKIRLHFRHNLFSSSSPRATLYCTCRSSNLPNWEVSTEPFVLTTPLYYVNSPPHMGSAYTTIAADAVARFQRLLGKKVIFITGTDEHGEKIATAAAANGSSPSEHCDVISQAYKALWEDLDIAYDKFIRTTDPKHEVIVKEFYSRVLANGDSYQADYEGLYCVNCEEYKGRTCASVCMTDCFCGNASRI